MATLVLTVIGDDRAGLVEALADVIASHGGSWTESHMAELAGKFAGIVLVSVPDSRQDELTAQLEPLEAQGLLDITATSATTADADAHSVGDVDPIRELTLELVGQDRPGIIRDISKVLADHGVSIGELRTEVSSAPMAGGELFQANAILSAPASVDVAAVCGALEALANELMVDIDLAQRLT